MASESAPDDKPQQNPDSEPEKPMTGERNVASGGTVKEASSPSVFVNSEPIREDQVQNAVNFLSHPRVKGSPVMYRRSFLEKKGLTREEIDEAFRRVPDPAPTVTTSGNQNQDGQVKTATNVQQQPLAQTPQPAVAAPTGVVSTMTALRPYRFNWSHALLAVGFLAASGVGTAVLFKKTIVPRLKSWIRKVVLEEENDNMEKLDPKPSLVEETAAAAKAAAAAAADVARASQEMMNSKVDERRYFEAMRNLLDVQVEEMKSMGKAIRNLEATKEVAMSYKPTEELKSTSSNLMPLSAPASAEPSAAPHPKSYMEIMAMVQRGEKPPGIKEINDLPPNPNQPPSNPRLAPRLKPWETSQGQNGSYQVEGSNVKQPWETSQGQHGSYQVEGSNVKQPWETSQGQNGSYQVEGSNVKPQDYYPSSQSNADNSDPWWQRRTVRNTEVEPEVETKVPSYRPVTNQRTWVPPQPPPIVMPEAAAAIRQPKTVNPTEQVNGNQLISHSSNDFDELQRITKISELGSEVEINEVNTVPRVTEIEEEQ